MNTSTGPPPPTKGRALVRFCSGAGESGGKFTGVEKQVLAKDLVVLAGEMDEDGYQMADMKWRVGKGKKVKVEKWRCVVLECCVCLHLPFHAQTFHLATQDLQAAPSAVILWYFVLPSSPFQWLVCVETAKATIQRSVADAFSGQ